MSDSERRGAERKVAWAKAWARAKQVLTSDPTGSDEDDLVVEDAADEALARQGQRLKGGMAKLAQRNAYDGSGRIHEGLAQLWDRVQPASAGDIARVVERELGRAPQQAFAAWSAEPLAAASLGQVHAARLHDGTEVVVKVQYPHVAAALTADLADPAFVRKLAGRTIDAKLDDDTLQALAAAVRAELDYRAEAAGLERFGALWARDPIIAVPRLIGELSTARVLTMTRAGGVPLTAWTSNAALPARKTVATALLRFGWAGPLRDGVLNADPNPGNFLVEDTGDKPRLWCLDFGCVAELSEHALHAERELVWGLMHAAEGPERFRMALSEAGMLRRRDSLAWQSHRSWEAALLAPFRTPSFRWTPQWAGELQEATREVLEAGGLALSPETVLAWRQRIGMGLVIALCDAEIRVGDTFVGMIGSGRAALR